MNKNQVMKEFEEKFKHKLDSYGTAYADNTMKEMLSFLCSKLESLGKEIIYYQSNYWHRDTVDKVIKKKLEEQERELAIKIHTISRELAQARINKRAYLVTIKTLEEQSQRHTQEIKRLRLSEEEIMNKVHSCGFLVNWDGASQIAKAILKLQEKDE